MILYRQTRPGGDIRSRAVSAFALHIVGIAQIPVIAGGIIDYHAGDVLFRPAQGGCKYK
ncbi:hypothetical protein D3C81_2150130 [compost metagenome]